METKEVLKQRRSVHYFDSSREIPEKDIKELFDLVKLAPSGYNLQPWEFILIRDPENKKKLRKCAYNQHHVEESSATVIVCGNMDPTKYAERNFQDWVKHGYYSEVDVERTMKQLNKLKQDKDFCKMWTMRSTCLAAMQLMIAAFDMGIGTCPMEGFDPEMTAKEFSIPEDVLPVMLIALGYERQPALPRTYRRPFEDIVHYEKFGEHQKQG